jgi:uncharacterized SAM-binding protein YcdF (DUF218 family)
MMDAFKPLALACLLPPVPMLALMFWGAWRIRHNQRLGWSMMVLGAGLQWFASTDVMASALSRTLLQPPPAWVAPTPLQEQHATQTPSAILVLGGGRRESMERGDDLNGFSLERLRYGVWLSRSTGMPLAFSGGVGLNDRPGASEAALAQRIVAQEYGHALRWVEAQSTTTRENARLAYPMLRKDGVRRIVVVTHQMHMPRALLHLQQQRAAAGETQTVEIVAAPVATPVARAESSLSDWMPTFQGGVRVRYALYEVLAGWAARWSTR